MMNVNGILAVAVVLLVIWVVAAVTKFIAGALLNLVLIAGIVLLVVWAVRKVF
jgi:hypothetical protein